MSNKRSIEVAKSYLFDAYNQAEHADRMVQSAQHLIDRRDVSGALNDLRIALKAAESAPFRIENAIEYLEALQKEQG